MSDEGYTWKTYIVDFEEELSITNESLTMPGADATWPLPIITGVSAIRK